MSFGKQGMFYNNSKIAASFLSKIAEDFLSDFSLFNAQSF